ncbi:glycosyltransferase family 61 protein [Acetobacteraceae bacterium KSS8]|uniref:Glycosyltransferase family 61 protein n=1 Tax=Endosaccharibacter trunci TaxID=2812733 RepID=A0ABT1W8I6_9PROT|nr:glycosyltransferase family 61 protein [Acetobacteraceae bacterium KSS8]
MTGMVYVSCAKAELYRNGSWYDDPIFLNELTHGTAARHAPDVIAEIFPPYQYERPVPMLLGGGTDELQHVASVAHSTAESFKTGPATVLARVGDCCVSRSVIYLLRDNETFIIYETHRPSDRGVSHLRNENEIRLVDDYKRHDPFIAYLWVGSAGSMNYGHWLVDDLPRLAALTELRRLRPYAKIVIVTPECGPKLDALHAQTAGAIAAMLDIDNVELMTVARDARIFFQELYFVSPPTHHPVLKSPDAMNFVADYLQAATGSLSSAGGTLPRRLFVGREWTGARDLANQHEIAEMLSGHGFVSVETGTMPVLEQTRLFSHAEIVIGCMGASMTNSLFCPEGAGIGYISPHGWIETFYWDLASTRRQRYVACYGPSTPQDAPAWQKNFRVNPAHVQQMLDELAGNAETPTAKQSMAEDPAATFNPFRT